MGEGQGAWLPDSRRDFVQQPVIYQGGVQLLTFQHKQLASGRHGITGAIKWSDANFVFGQVRGLRGHTPWLPP
jgi:hypothetical protein